MEFNELKVGQDVIVFDKRYHETFNAKVVLVGKQIPYNYKYELLDTKEYNFVSVINIKGEKTINISAFRDEHKNYMFFETFEDFKKSINDIVNAQLEKDLFAIEENRKHEIDSAHRNADRFKERLLKIKED